ncbi:MAG: glycosyltransferase family 2 protein [Terracidiphilus sp.]
MTKRASHPQAAPEADGAAVETVEPRHEPRTPASAVPSSVDLAYLVDNELLVYGWVMGLAKPGLQATLTIGDVAIDLKKQAVLVGRPDVAKHFSLAAEDDEHGFYALVDLPDGFSARVTLTLSVVLPGGKATETHWPVSHNKGETAKAIAPHVQTLSRLLPQLSKRESHRLIEFGSPSLGLPSEVKEPPKFPFTVRFGIDLCCILDKKILVISGWQYDPLKEMTASALRVGSSKFKLLANSVLYNRPDIDPEPLLHWKRNETQCAGFNFVCALPSKDAEPDEVWFSLTAGGAVEHRSQPVNNATQEARRELLQLATKMEPESALVLIERIIALADGGLAEQSLLNFLEHVRHGVIERLPASIQQASPRYALHLDQAIPVSDQGLFLVGWFNSEAQSPVRIVCHSGAESFVVSDNWSRHARADVTTYLAGTGIPSGNHAHGFSCYVPLSDSDTPPYLSAQSESGDVRRMRIQVQSKPESALQTVRALATSFSSKHPELRYLLDRQIGPAVGAAWAARSRPQGQYAPRYFGSRPANPAVSIIVPLFGRHDFAEYQMALFADDLDFQHTELIYVVDDPEILSDFLSVCADLYGIFRVPFTVVSPRENLGFAGANNLGATEARGQHLLLLNSDVLPKRPGWVSELLRIYNSLANPGMLGAKLLYEDGSVQHAGIAFRQYADWGNMWVNDHPFKGQHPGELNGIREEDAVTAACALVNASLFGEAGGFSEDYIIGDFEDSDLCLKLRSIGHRNYIALDVELYHLERQSQNRMGDDTWRTNLTLYNCWLHNIRWEEWIAAHAKLGPAGTQISN